jgi:hypothetical protein
MKKNVPICLIFRIVLFLQAVVLSGCARVGPEIIRASRPAYNDAILQTSDEQLLQNIVRLRFGDSIGFLMVSSVTANVSVSATGNVEAGVGPTSNYSGNLVPLSGSLTTEEHPTISYTPVSGDRMLRQLLSETPLELAISLINNSQHRQEAWRVLVRRINHFRNPDFIDPPALDTDPQFYEIVRLCSTLQERGNLSWVRPSSSSPDLAILLHSYRSANSAEVMKLIGLLDVMKPANEGDDIIIPVYLSAGSAKPGVLNIETRSLYNLMLLSAVRIELPKGKEAESLHYAKPNSITEAITIHSSTSRPEQPRATIKYHGYWYYIEQTDETSKLWFQLLELLSNAQVPEASSAAPLITIPASGKK